MSAREVNEAVNSVWSIFRSAGIADDLTIIEHIAWLLLDESGLGLRLPSHLLPRCPPQRDEFEDESEFDYCEFDRLKRGLRLAAEQLEGDNAVQKFANLFDQHILFRLSEMLAGSRYPTPRHIAHFMYALAQVSPNDFLADFACGSGGLLITREILEEEQESRPLDAKEQKPRTFGIEISPEWARIARANLLLHEIPFQSNSIQDGNALNIDKNSFFPSVHYLNLSYLSLNQKITPSAEFS